MTTLAFEKRDPGMVNRIRRWLLQGVRDQNKGEHKDKAPWWQVMCLTGGICQLNCGIRIIGH